MEPLPLVTKSVTAKPSDQSDISSLKPKQTATTSFPKSVDDSQMILLTVDKTKLTASLKTWPTDASAARQLRNFRIAIGKASGDKQVEGDNKTPEGVYFAQGHIDGRGLPERYGAMAIPLDFPNPVDRLQGKTGHGIWLHGVDDDKRIEEAMVTEGCVAFYNPDIARLRNWLKGHQGVVVIAEDATKINEPIGFKRGC